MSVPPLKNYLSPETTVEDPEGQYSSSALSPRRRTVSRFHADYDVETVALKASSLSPSFAGAPMNLTAIGDSCEGDDGSPLPKSNVIDTDKVEGDRSGSSMKPSFSMSNVGASPYASPEIRQQRISVSQSQNRLFVRENERSLSVAASRILSEEEQQIQHENQIATHIELAAEEQRRKEQERRERRTAKKAKEDAKKAKTDTQSPKSVDVIALTRLDHDNDGGEQNNVVFDADEEATKTTATSAPHTETALFSSVSSHSEEVSELDRTTINSTPQGSNNAQNQDCQRTWSDTVSVASDCVVGSDTMVPRQPTTTVSAAAPVTAPPAPKKNESFWEGLFKKDKERGREPQRKTESQKTTTSSRFLTSQPESSSNFSKATEATSVNNQPAEAVDSQHKEVSPKVEPQLTSNNPAIQVQPLSISLRAKVVLLGEQGSGKTSFKACFTSSVLKSQPEVSPSAMSSSSAFYFKAESTSRQKHRQLDISVVDSGPLPLTAGVTNFYDNGTLFIMTLSLAGVKQKTPPKSLNPFGPKPVAEPIIFEGDRKMIKSYLQTIASVAPRNSAFVLIGTFMDVLSETTPAAVEAVVGALRSIVLEELSKEFYSIMFRGCFAISSLDHKVVSEIKPTGPKYISDLWSMLCETMMKDALSNRGGVVLQTPSSFGWNAESMASALNNLEEMGERLIAETKPQIGNLANTLLAKFISENTRGEKALTDTDASLNATVSSINTATPLSTRRGESIRNTALTNSVIASPAAGNNNHPFAWLLNLTADPAIIIENAVPFTEKMFKQTCEFESVEKHCIRIRHTNASPYQIFTPSLEASCKLYDANQDEEFVKPCRADTVSQKGLPNATDNDAGDKPRAYRELIGNAANRHSPISLLTYDDEIAQLLILRATSKAQLFIQRAKQELNLVISPLHVLRQHFYSIGVTSNVHFNALIESLCREGDITLFKNLPSGREETVLFQPHLASRATFTLIRGLQLSSYPVADRKKLMPTIDADEVQLADPGQLFPSSGMLSDLLLVAFSGCLSHLRKTKGEAADLFLFLLEATDFIVSCREAANLELPTNRSLSSNPNDTDELSQTATKSGISSYFYSKTPKKSKIDLLFETKCSFIGQGWRFVAPSLVKKSIGVEKVRLIEQVMCLFDIRKVKSNSSLFAHRQQVLASPSPPFLRYKLICRLSRFIEAPNCVFNDGVWLSHPQLSGRCLLQFEANQGELINISCVAEGNRMGAFEIISEVLKEIRSYIKSELKGTTLTVSNSSVKIDPKFQSAEYEQFASAQNSKKLLMLDSLIAK